MCNCHLFAPASDVSLIAIQAIKTPCPRISDYCFWQLGSCRLERLARDVSYPDREADEALERAAERYYR